VRTRCLPAGVTLLDGIAILRACTQKVTTTYSIAEYSTVKILKKSEKECGASGFDQNGQAAVPRLRMHRTFSREELSLRVTAFMFILLKYNNLLLSIVDKLTAIIRH
jgi:hypothetical protein